jgi:hypothetical protein
VAEMSKRDFYGAYIFSGVEELEPFMNLEIDLVDTAFGGKK